MMTSSKTATLEKLLPLLEAFGAARVEMRQLRRDMRSKECTGRSADEPAPCYHQTDGRTPWCDNCREHDLIFHQLLQVRKRQTKRMNQIERLAIRFAAPEPEIPSEPKLLLELIEQSS
jgi:hypothetical protein